MSIKDNFICCICLQNTEKFTYTSCCKNYIHKSCILTWIIYNCKIECCLCRSNKIQISEDIISYNINNIQEYNINKNTFINNLNKIINELNGNDSIIIHINDNDDNDDNNDDNDDNISTGCCLYFNNRRNLKDLLSLFLIPIFYILLFYIIPNTNK